MPRLWKTHRLALKLKSLIVGWPPQVVLEPTPGDDVALHPLFIFLEGKTLLRYGFGTRAGITDLTDLRSRVDDIRDQLRIAMTALPPRASVAQYLRKLQDACHELIGAANTVLWGADGGAAEPSDLVPAVDQLREAFALVAERVADRYQLPAARHLADQIRADLSSPPPVGQVDGDG